MHTQLQDTLSLEIFPPKTPEGMTKLKRAVTKLNTLKPKYFSCTYGAGGSTRERTFETVSWLREQQIETAPHLACIGSGKEEIHEIVEHYANQGISRLVALRGDLPSGMGRPDRGTFRYASELVTYLREAYGSRFRIEVAAYPEFHPQATSASADLEHFKHKVACGADAAITQYFFNADAYFAFLDACEKNAIAVPVIPGIMPITNYSQLARFSDACGAEIPRWIRLRLEAFGDNRDAIRDFGHEVVLKLCERLLAGGAPGLHFYTMNQAKPTLALCTDLGMASASSTADV